MDVMVIIPSTHLSWAQYLPLAGMEDKSLFTGYKALSEPLVARSAVDHSRMVDKRQRTATLVSAGIWRATVGGKRQRGKEEGI